MRQVSMTTRDELLAAVKERYRHGQSTEKTRILDEFVAVTGYHRKHAMRVLRREGSAPCTSVSRRSRRVYNDATREALVLLWEASDRICGKRLKPLMLILIEAMERHGHLQLDPDVRTGLLSMSAATIDRALCEVREQAGGRKRRRAAPSSAIRRRIPIRTFADWQDPPPGFIEADLVAHSGPSTKGHFVQSIVLTDIATGWTECAPLLFREQKLLSEAFLEGLRTAWKEGDVRPTARPKAKQKRGRRRPDPLVAVTVQLREWFEAEPWLTGRELFERLQTAHPNTYPDGLLRTLQRRLKIWRSEKAQLMVFGPMHADRNEQQGGVDLPHAASQFPAVLDSGH